jgi:hypothetical protein
MAEIAFLADPRQRISPGGATPRTPACGGPMVQIAIGTPAALTAGYAAGGGVTVTVRGALCAAAIFAVPK